MQVRISSTRTRRLGIALTALLAVAVGFFAGSAACHAQSVGFVTQRPFVVGWIPVVGRNGAVGGVSVTAEGLLDRAEVESLGRLRIGRQDALQSVPSELNDVSPLRKISLKRLDQAVAAAVAKGEPLSDEVLFLAGLQRIESVYVYPEHQDIVIAGYAEGWKVDRQGELVGRTNGRPVLRLEDLIIALRATHNPIDAPPISCSIDPSPEGLENLRLLLDNPQLTASATTLKRLEEGLGTQHVTISGVPPDSHFARVMVSADFLMKRLAMGLEKSPVNRFPSYMELVRRTRGDLPQNAMPRWWLTAAYDQVTRDADGLAWSFQGTAVSAKSEQGLLAADLAAVAAADDVLIDKWAALFSQDFDNLADELPVFAQLQGCMDLAMVAALIQRQHLCQRANCELTALIQNAHLTTAAYYIPRTVASRASLVRKGRNWIISLSGGVQVDPWTYIEQADLQTELAPRLAENAPPADRWWWD